MNIADLQVEDDVVPLFDNHLNAYSRKALANLFRDAPTSPEAVKDQQAILAALIASPRAIAALPNYQRDLPEVFSFTTSFTNNDVEFSSSNISLRVRHLFNRKEGDFLRSKALQWSFLIHTLYEKCFNSLAIEQFPSSYKEKVLGIIELMKSFRQYFLKEDGFSLSKARANYIHILRKLSTSGRDGTLSEFWTNIFNFDAYASIATTIKSRKFQFVEFSQAEFSIKGLYHPLLSRPVPNDLSLNRRVLLLTGPNMSGKSTILKSLSLCIYLSKLGIAVPASSCTIPYYDELYVHLNSRDSLSKGVSHFMEEITLLKTALQSASSGKRVFAAFDEIFSGTNIDDAYSLLETTINGVQKFEGSCVVLSTHLDCSTRTTTENGNHTSIFHLGADLSTGLPIFHYKLREGWSNQRLGKFIFNQSGLNKLLSDE